MNNGFIVLHRKIIDNPIWQKVGLAHLFTTLLLLTAHKEVRFLWNGKEETLKRGQLLTGRDSLAKQTGLNPRTTYDYLKILQNLEIINIKSNNKFSLITIVKYSQYQDKMEKSNSTSNNQPTTSQQPANTYNNINNDNNKYVAKATMDLDKYPLKDYKLVTEAYKRIKNVTPQGKEWLPIQKEIKTMFQSKRTPQQIIEAMEVCNNLYPDWAMSTIRMKIADVVSGKLTAKTKSGENVLKIKSIKQL